jgi:hypothetical protein
VPRASGSCARIGQFIATLNPDTGEVIRSVQAQGVTALVALGVAIPEPTVAGIILAVAAAARIRRRQG